MHRPFTAVLVFFCLVLATTTWNIKSLSAATPTDDLFASIKANNRSAFDAALRKGAKLDALDEFKNTPLMVAILHGRSPLVARLIERGAAVNAAGGAGQTPLILAAQEGQLANVRLLLGKGARLAQKDNSGESAFTRAVLNNQLAVMRELLERGADPNQRNWLGFTPVMIAAEQSPEARSFLLDRGGRLRTVARSGLTPLMLAGLRGNAATVKILLERGARPDEVDVRGRSALMFAVRSPDVLRLLLKHGAKPGLRDRDGRSARDHALRRGFRSSADLLRRAQPSGRRNTDGSRLHGAP